MQAVGKASDDGVGHGPQDPLLGPEVEPDPDQERDRLAVQRVRTHLDQHSAAGEVQRNDQSEQSENRTLKNDDFETKIKIVIYLMKKF